MTKKRRRPGRPISYLLNVDMTSVVRTAETFFSKASPAGVPPVLMQPSGTWLPQRRRWFLALFYLSQGSVARVREYRARGWEAFPTLFTPTENDIGLVDMGGKDGLFVSTSTRNGYGFRVRREASFILENHRHVANVSGARIEFIVDLGFIFGAEALTEFATIDEAFLHLFTYLTQSRVALE